MVLGLAKAKDLDPKAKAKDLSHKAKDLEFGLKDQGQGLTSLLYANVVV